MTAKRWVEDSAVCVFAAILLALSYEIFIFPNQFAPAGLPGIATMIQHIFKFNAGYMMYLFNIPLLVAMILLGNKEFTIKSAIFSMVFSGALLVFGSLDLSRLAYHTENGTSLILAPIAGGVISGYCYGIVFRRGGSTGGMDLVAALVQHRCPEQNILWIVFIINALVAAGSFFVYNMKYEPVILCLLYCFISSKVGDIMLRGFKEAIKFEVVTDRPEALEEAILQSMGHGVTEIRAVGGYTHEKKTMLICVINKHQIVQFQRLLKQYPGSFAYLSSVKETVGNFRNIH